MFQNLDKCRLMRAARIGATFAWFLSYGLVGQLLGLAFGNVSPIVLSIVADIVFFFAGVYIYRRLRVDPRSLDVRDRPDLFSTVWRFAFLFVLWFCSYIIGNVLSAILPDPAMSQYVAIQTEQVIPFAILSVLIAPVAEELLFRGVGYLLMRPCCGIFCSALVSSVVFGLLHGTLAQFFMGTVFGFGQCLLFEYTHKLRWCVVMHILVNAVSFIVARLSIPVDLFLSGPLVLFLLIIIVISFVMLLPGNRF